MKTLHLATTEDLPRVAPLVEAFATETGRGPDPETLEAALVSLLDGAPQGALWLIGPRRAPVGYVTVGFGWSLEAGGLVAEVDQLFIRPAVRRRGMGGEALDALARTLGEAGARAIRIAVPEEDAKSHRFYARARFRARTDRVTLVRTL